MDKNKAERLSSFIAQVAAVRWANAQVPEITAANQITRKFLFRKAVQLELGPFSTIARSIPKAEFKIRRWLLDRLRKIRSTATLRRIESGRPLRTSTSPPIFGRESVKCSSGR